MTMPNHIHSFDRVGGLRAGLRSRYDAWKTYRATHRELASLSDRELSDLGLGRGDISAVAHQAAYGG